ncbi:MAG: hypothetical protein KJ025_13430 [Burkholderiales bacterium]|nr:hypothetical protein [Burkholderiales bacterium]
MADSVRKVEYFSTQVPDRPGEAFRVLSTLVSANVNLLACTGFPRGSRSQIDVVPEDARRFRTAVRKAGLAFTAKKAGFMIQGEDRAGALAEWLALLAGRGINVTAVDALTAGRGRWGAILWVAPGDVARAAKALGARAGRK